MLAYCEQCAMLFIAARQSAGLGYMVAAFLLGGLIVEVVAPKAPTADVFRVGAFWPHRLEA